MDDATESAEPADLQHDPAGYLRIPALLPADFCHSLVSHLTRESGKAVDWVKGTAVGSRHFHDLALDYRIVKPVVQALGTEDVQLWGASLVRRDPGQAHPWHSDIESCGPEAHTVSVWIGLRNTRPESSLTVAPGSHRSGKAIQELAARDGIAREEIGDETVASWSNELGLSGDVPDPVCLVEMADGDALLFDGRLWHRSLNLDTELPRIAVLLQYTAADAPVRMPDFRQLSWPFRFLDHPRIPCLPVSGNHERHRVSPNRTVTPPLLFGAEDGRRLSSSVRELALPLVETDLEGLRSFPVFRGYTHHLADFSCHVSALSRGHSPHPPHHHPEEEILLVLSGEAEIHLPLMNSEEERRTLRRGEFAYYPAGCWHTLTGASEAPVHYVMLKWFGERTHESPALVTGFFDGFDGEATDLGNVDGFRPSLLFEGATDLLSKLHCHRSVLEPGAGYDPHPDDYDVVLLILEGEVETLGQRVKPFGVVHYAAGEPHGIRNPTDRPAHYLVFELHGSQGSRLRIHDRPPAEVPFVPIDPQPQPQSLPRVQPEAMPSTSASDGGDWKRLEKQIDRFEKRMERRMKQWERRLPKPRHRLNLRDRYFSWARWKRRFRRWSRFQTKSMAERSGAESSSSPLDS